MVVMHKFILDTSGVLCLFHLVKDTLHGGIWYRTCNIQVSLINNLMIGRIELPLFNRPKKDHQPT